MKARALTEILEREIERDFKKDKKKKFEVAKFLADGEKIPLEHYQMKAYERFRKLDAFRGTRAAKMVQIGFNPRLGDLGASGLTQFYGQSIQIMLDPSLTPDPLRFYLVVLHELVHVSGIDNHRREFKEKFVEATLEAVPASKLFLTQDQIPIIPRMSLIDVHTVLSNAMFEVWKVHAPELYSDTSGTYGIPAITKLFENRELKKEIGRGPGTTRTAVEDGKERDG